MATTDYFAQYEAVGNGPSVTSPSELSYHTPLASSRPSSRRTTGSRGTPTSRNPSTSPPPLPSSDDPRSSGDFANDESISILDPRRFTPTLHASLVSEILNLRRDLDSKHRTIEDLESNLATSKNENEVVHAKFNQVSKENRAAKQQLQQLEHGTLSAIEELAKERDQANQTTIDFRSKLETALNRIRSSEEDAERMQGLWDREREEWEGQRRALERKVHVTESRLRTVLDEVSAAQAAAQAHEQETDVGTDDHTEDSGLGIESDTTSSRSYHRAFQHCRNQSSVSSHKSFGRNVRQSTQSTVGSDGHAKVNGASLADELMFDDVEEEEEREEEEREEEETEENTSDESDMGYLPEHELRARRALEYRQSVHPDEKAKRVLGIAFDDGAAVGPTRDDVRTRVSHASPASDLSMHGKYAPSGKTVVAFEDDRTIREERTPTPQPPSPITPAGPEYVDSGVQFSPPPSPKLAPKARLEEPKPLHDESTVVEANQARKRGSSSLRRWLSRESVLVEKPTPVMVSAASQTVEEPLSPPATPKVSEPPSPQLEPVRAPAEMVSASTQTDRSEAVPTIKEPEPQEPPTPKRAAPPPPIPIPSIAIHPPVSGPNSPKEAVLPPGTKSAGCQTSALDFAASYTSSSMQTEEIRTDKRLAKLPPHLLPSAISSNPPSPEPTKSLRHHESRRDIEQTPAKAIPASTTSDFSPDISSSPPPIAFSRQAVENRYPGNNDNAPVAHHKGDDIRRPFRSSSLFAGFDDDHSEDEIQGMDGVIPNTETYSAQQPAARSGHGRPMHRSRPFNNPPTPVPEEKENSSSPERIRANTGKTRAVGSAEDFMTASRRSSFEKPAKVSKPVRGQASHSRGSSVRRSAMISSGTAAHMNRSRSPSLGSMESSTMSHGSGPPFPVPTRLSSRRIPVSKSEGSQSPTPRGSASFSYRHNGVPPSSKLEKRDGLRKVRSAAVIPRNGTAGRRRSRSPQKDYQKKLAQLQELPPLPRDAVTSPYLYTAHKFPPNMIHQQLPQQQQAAAALAATPNGQTHGVVDAIASTMVGEWMWKYTRRRKSFIGPEAPQDFSKSPDDAAMSHTGNGNRHRRWVWLSPYERCVLWSAKQPTNGQALMGRSGRKLAIKSVLDVADETPQPRGSGHPPAFNRSILILTPARALKFTAFTRERHYLWLQALSFLAHSANGPGAAELAFPPPVPEREPEPEPRPSATLNRAPVRDSIRIAKSRAPQLPVPGAVNNHVAETFVSEFQGDSRFAYPIADAADPPTIPRFHSRKRSLTGPGARPPPVPQYSSLRSFTQPPHMPPSINTSIASSEHWPIPSGMSSPYAPTSGRHTPSGFSVNTGSRNSEVSNGMRPDQNFFDALGTMRMEAFVSPRPSEDSNSKMSVASRMRGRRRGNSQWSNASGANRSGMVYADDFDAFDPFKNF